MKEIRPQPQEPLATAGEPASPPKPGCLRLRNLLLVLLLLIVLAAIAIPNFISYRQRGGSCITGNSDVKNGYTSSQAYFSDYPDGVVDVASLSRYGFTQSPSVIVVIRNGTRSGLSITAEHRQTETTYTVDATGKITKG